LETTCNNTPLQANAKNVLHTASNVHLQLLVTSASMAFRFNNTQSQTNLPLKCVLKHVAMERDSNEAVMMGINCQEMDAAVHVKRNQLTSA